MEDDTIRASLTSQFHAALGMLESAVQKCPQEAWDDPAHANRTWLVAYHALFYVHLYLQPSLAHFVAWEKHRENIQDLGRPVDGAGVPYTRQDTLDYAGICHAQIDEQIARMDLRGPSGFDWITLNKFEHQVYSIRHLQQHAGELCERIKTAGNADVDWMG